MIAGAQYSARRTLNLVAAAVLALLAVMVALLAVDPSYPWYSHALAVVFVAVFSVLGVRCCQASVVIGDQDILVRRFLRSTRLTLDEVSDVVVVDTFDGPRRVRKLAILAKDGRILRTHYQSPRPIRGHAPTKIDEVTTEIHGRLRLLQ
jgi:hypothetical protein